MPNPKSEREHGDLTATIFRGQSGVTFIRQPSGAVYMPTRQGWRKVPDEIVAQAEAMQKAGEAA